MKDEIDVSVHMLAYNHENFIAKAIEGVMKQETEYKFELVIGEDRSSDQTLEVIEEYIRRYPDKIRLITSENNVGMVENTIRTFHACTGRYVAFCEGDDYWQDPEKIQKQLDFLENNPEYGLIHTDNDILYEETGKIIRNMNKIRGDDFSKNDNAFYPLLSGDYAIHTLTVVTRRDLIIGILGSNIFLNPENKQTDLIMWLEVAFHSKIKYFPSSTSVYRMRKGSASKPEEKIAKLDFQISSRRIRLDYARKYNAPKRVMDIVEDNYYYSLLAKAYELNEKDSGIKSFEKIKKKNPSSKLMVFALKHGIFKIILKFLSKIRNLIMNRFSLKKRIHNV